MKKYFLFLSLILNNQLQASDNYQLFCSGNRGKVNVLFEKVNDVLRFTYTNIDGKKSFPIYEGVVTPDTLPFIKLAQKDLAVIDTKLVIEWKIEKCSKPTDNNFIIACDGEANIVYPPNSKLKSYDFFTSLLEEKTPTFNYEVFKVRLGLDSENLHYLASMPFDPNLCQVNNPDAILSK